MKTPLVPTLLILALGAVIGLRQEKKVTELRAEGERLKTLLADAGGIPPSTVITKRQRLETPSPTPVVDFSKDGPKARSLAATAGRNPELAFKLLREQGLTGDSSAIQAIAQSARTFDQRSAVLAAMRGQIVQFADEAEGEFFRGEVLSGIARSLSGESFEAVTGWMETDEFSPDENEWFAAGLLYQNTRGDTHRWIDWISGNLAAAQLDERVGNLVGQWTQQDYLAAGNWLAAAENSPAKEAAVKSYAATVAEHEPQIAAQWAMTLPPGDGRDSTFRLILENWPPGDDEGAEAFAAAHGIVREAP